MEKYEKQHCLGSGAFGQVFRGIHKASGLAVAMKFIAKAGKSPKDIMDIKNEIYILTCLNHPSIVELLDHFETSEDYCLVTELAIGDLHNTMATGKAFPEELVCDIGRQMISALAYVHQENFIHRDVKPANILLLINGNVKLCDFGLAMRLPQDGCVRGSDRGTFNYAAPEVVFSHAYGVAADVFSLGVSLYELLAGYSPYDTCEEGDPAQRKLSGEFKFPSTWSEQMLVILKGMLSKKPEDRPTMEQLAQHHFFQNPIQEPILSLPANISYPGWVQAEIAAAPFRQLPIGHTPFEGGLNVNAAQRLQSIHPQAALAQAKIEAQDALALADAMAGVAHHKAAVANKARSEAEQAAALREQAASRALHAIDRLKELEALAHAQPAAVGPADSLAARIADIEAQEEALRARSAAVLEREQRVGSQEAAMKFREQALRMREAELNAAMQRGSAPVQLRGDSPQERQAALMTVAEQETSKQSEQGHINMVDEPLARAAVQGSVQVHMAPQHESMHAELPPAETRQEASTPLGLDMAPEDSAQDHGVALSQAEAKRKRRTSRTGQQPGVTRRTKKARGRPAWR